MITTADFTSYYPHLQFIHDCIAAHIPSNVYSNLVKSLFSERKKYPKDNPLNYIYKIYINLLFGLSNSEYSALYDSRATLKTTINGMLIISMIADRIYSIPNAKILMKNTDGLEIYHLRSDQSLVESILNDISKLVNIPIEIDYYNKMVILNVNCYIAITTSGKVKVKGVFETYEDIISLGAYHKDTSASIIPLAIQNYFIKSIPIENTINNHNNIYDFCYGAKGSSQYKWHITEYNNDKRVAVSRLFDHRFLRYYAGGNETLSQYWTKGKREGTIQATQANTPVTICLNLPKADIYDYNKKGERILRYDINNNIIERYPNLDRNWYIQECFKIINQIENH